MILEKYPRTRNLARKLLELSDRLTGVAFPQMTRPKQIDIYSCGPAVIASLYSYLGLRISQRSIIASLRVQQKIKRYGLSMKDMARAAQIVGKGKFTFWKKSSGKISDLDTVINKYKYPVGVEWQGVFYEYADEDDGHFAIITKIDKKAKYLRIADPYRNFSGVDRKFGIKFFENRWWDENEISISGTTRKRKVSDYRVMFVITKKGETWPEKVGMSKVRV